MLLESDSYIQKPEVDLIVVVVVVVVCHAHLRCSQQHQSRFESVVLCCLDRNTVK